MRFRCRTCKAILTLEGNKRDIAFDPGSSPYGGPYPHPSTLDCPLLQGLSEGELRAREDVEEL